MWGLEGDLGVVRVGWSWWEILVGFGRCRVARAWRMVRVRVGDIDQGMSNEDVDW